MCDLIFKRFEFDAEFGFVIPSPLLRLDEYFDPWINLVTELELLRKTPDQLKKRLRCRIFSCLGPHDPVLTESCPCWTAPGCAACPRCGWPTRCSPSSPTPGSTLSPGAPPPSCPAPWRFLGPRCPPDSASHPWWCTPPCHSQTGGGSQPGET